MNFFMLFKFVEVCVCVCNASSFELWILKPTMLLLLVWSFRKLFI